MNPNEHPIIFSANMVQAILNGRKTQTRRVLIPQPESWVSQVGWDFFSGLNKIAYRGVTEAGPAEYFQKAKYKKGDRLWVRETFGTFSHRHQERHDDYFSFHTHKPNYPDLIAIYRASDRYPKHFYDDKMDNWISPIFMPRWASRITLRVVTVSINHLKDISLDDVKAEGCTGRMLPGKMIVTNDGYQHIKEFQYLWNSINEKRGYSWDYNPWVWKIEFEREL